MTSKCAHCGGLVVRWNSEERRCAACGRPPGPAPRVATGAVAERKSDPVFHTPKRPAPVDPEMSDTLALYRGRYDEQRRRYLELRRLGISRQEAAQQVGVSGRSGYRWEE